MKDKIAAWVGWLLLFAALGLYCFGVFEAVERSWNGNGKTFDEMKFIPGILGSLQAIFLTNLGAVLGISVVKPSSSLARQILPHTKNSVDREIVDPLNVKEKIQLLALCVYLISLIVCLLVWWRNDFTMETSVASIVIQSGQIFFGVVLAYISLVFARN